MFASPNSPSALGLDPGATSISPLRTHAHLQHAPRGGASALSHESDAESNARVWSESEAESTVVMPRVTCWWHYLLNGHKHMGKTTTMTVQRTDMAISTGRIPRLAPTVHVLLSSSSSRARCTIDNADQARLTSCSAVRRLRLPRAWASPNLSWVTNGHALHPWCPRRPQLGPLDKLNYRKLAQPY